MQPGWIEGAGRVAPALTARPERAPGPAGGWGGLDAAARVLALVADPQRPLADRLRLRAVLGRHLDGVFRTRVAPPPPTTGDPDLTPPVPVTSRLLRRLVTDHDVLVHESLVPALRAAGTGFVGVDDLTRAEGAAVRRLLRHHVHPLLTPMAVDGGRPFPALACGSLTVVARVREQPGAAPRLGFVGVPAALPRVVRLGSGRVLAAETLVAALLPDLFAGTSVVEHACLRVTRSTGRGGDGRPAPVTRVELERSASDWTVHALSRRLGVSGEQVYPVRSSLSMGDALSEALPDQGGEDVR